MPVGLAGYDRFTLLGRGGFSEVYRARQVAFDRDVAVKVLDVGLDERQRRAFERECRAMGVVSQHPNIVTLYSADYTSDGRPCLVMELYEGGTYGDRLRTVGRIDLRTVLEVGVKLCGALQTAHDRGVLHRDVKPQNVFVSSFGEPALGDFGISSVGDDVESRGAAGLSVHYAAPEVIAERAASAASDVYSVGATLYTMLAARRPFAIPGRHQDVSEVALRVLRDPVTPIGGAVPPEVDELLQEVMAKNPEDRPASAEALAKALQSVQDVLGFERTTIPLETRTPEGAAVPPGAPRDQTMTVVHPDDVTFTDRVKRRVPAMTYTLVAALATWGVVLLAASADDDAPPQRTEVAPDAVVANDDFFESVPRPTNVTLERAEGGAVKVMWDGRPGLSYEVTRVDTAAETPRAQIVEMEQTILRDIGPGEVPCVQISSIGEEGRVSPQTEPVCLSE